MEQKTKTIGILTSGGDAPGMNACIRAVTRTAINKGMRVYGIKHGYCGLMNDEMFEMDMRSVSNIIHRGGTMLYTARFPEFKEEWAAERAVEVCHKHGIDGIVVIGGDGSFRGAAHLSRHGIPCVGLPGTIDNDIACTDYTIGYDTSMNTVLEMVDKIRDTCQSHDRCSVVEVMGRHAGFIAVNAGISCGAICIMTPEIPLSVDEVVARIKESQKVGKKNFIVMVAEGVGHSIEIAEKIERDTGIETRATILGHVQRGGNPTVRDRVAASQMGYYAVQLLEKGIGNRVIGLRYDSVVDYDVQEALSMTKPFDKEIYDIANYISY